MSVCACMGRGQVAKTHLAWQAGYSLFIRKGTWDTVLGSIKCPVGQGYSYVGALVQASRASPALLGEVQDPAPHGFCFA